ncbi:MAG: type I restriction enzyme HsdR N-terminal domain-containing protein [Bacteroidetes bacterium]|nr:type I restriction enzyme HsdR N-terminal domain-containing protein [Bacteroidota bacterium]
MELVFPTYPIKIENREGNLQVWDMIRRKWIILQKEEYVRQQLIQHMILGKEISKGRISVEKEIRYQKLRKRFDIVVYDSFGKPFILCEIKSPEIPLSQDTLNQISQYNSVIQAPHLLVTNGLELWFFSLDEAGKYQMKEW